jgi:hypothetical protein
MSKIVQAAFVAAALLTGVSTANAASAIHSVPDLSDEYGGYAPNSSEGVRAFWEYQTSKQS